MASTKISNMTAASDLTGAEIPIVQGGVNKKAASSLFTGAALTDGNATTANGTAADLGGTLSAPVAIDGAQPVTFGGLTSLSAWNAYVEVGDRLHSFEMDAGIINMDVYDSAVDRGGYTYPGDYDSSGDMGVEMGAYETTGIIKFALNALTGIATLVSTYAASVFNFVGVTLNLAQGADIASAGTTNIAAATGNSLTITGTTTITAFGTVQAGAKRTVTFSGVLTLTHNGTSLILPTGANITTAAGDVAIMLSLGSGNWKCIGYMRADGRVLNMANRVQSVTSSATVTANASTDDSVHITAQAVGLTLANPTGTATEDQMLVYRIKDNGSAQTIGYGSEFRALGVTLPTTTVISKTLYIACVRNVTDTKWDVIAVVQEA